MTQDKQKIKELKWEDAIERVLSISKTPMHYTDIAQVILEQGYRKPTPTPANSVSSNLGKMTCVESLGGGFYILNKFKDAYEKGMEIGPINERFIECYGRYWEKNKVDWNEREPHLYGNQVAGSKTIDFQKQIGIYLLHQGRDVVYVGQATKQSIGKRLRDHVSDRTRGRWDKFSWFGFYPVDERNAALNTTKEMIDKLNVKKLANALEALLIECFEPGLNYQGGNDWKNIIEYYQI